MNEIVSKFLLAGDKFMPEMHLKKPAFAYSACGPFTKNKERIEKAMQTGNTDFIYKNELDRACFQHNMAYGKSKDLIKRTQSDKVSKIAKRISFNDIQIFLIKNLVEVVLPNYQLADEIHKPIIRKFKKRKVYSSFRDNIWGVDLADMQSLSKYNKGIKY